MPEIKWDESFSVNHIEIDNQHKKWIEIFNEIHKGMMAGNDSDYSKITENTLEAMQEYARMHFQYEEEYMTEINYPDVMKHRRIHRDFDNLIYSYNRDLKEGNIVLNTEIIKLIRNWLIDHILNEDKKFTVLGKG